MEKITVPFTKQQVDKLNEYQLAGKFHPFTCDRVAKECEVHI